MCGARHGKPCPVCGQGTLHDGLRKEFIEYRGHKFAVEQRGAYCDHCDDGIVYHDPASEEALQKFRAGVDELERQELSAVRQYLGLTQQHAASISGGGHNAFPRYESGEARPVLSVVNLFRILGGTRSFCKNLELPGSKRGEPTMRYICTTRQRR